MFTGEINLAEIQKSLGITIQEGGKFILDYGLPAVNNYVMYKITVFSLWSFVLFLFLFFCLYQGNKEEEYFDAKNEPTEKIFWHLVGVLFLVGFLCVFSQALSYIIAPEISIIQSFRTNI